MSILNVEHVTHGFGARKILEDASFRLLKGEHIGLVGANGEGKTTFLNIITGKLMPDEGNVSWCNRITTGYLDQYSTLTQGKTIREVLREAFAYMFDQEQDMLAIYEKMSDCSDEEMAQLMEDAAEIQENLEHSGFYIIDSKIEEYANGLGLGEIGLDRDVHDLSGGQMQRMAIASIIAMRPDVIILDEPTSQLDPQGSNEVFRAVQSLSHEGITIIMVEHKMEKISAYSDRVMLLHDGKMIAFDTPQKVFSLEDLEQYGVNAPSFTRICKSLNLKNQETGCYPVTLEETQDAIGLCREGVHRDESY